MADRVEGGDVGGGSSVGLLNLTLGVLDAADLVGDGPFDLDVAFGAVDGDPKVVGLPELDHPKLPIALRTATVSLGTLMR